MRLCGDDQTKSLKARSHLYIELAFDRQFSKIICLPFRSYCPENVSRVISAERLRMADVFHLKPDARAAFLALDFGFSGSLRIEIRAHHIDCGAVIIFVPDGKSRALCD